jgi:cytosine/adenosine deaminase-related metal-dependent hydrolase
VADARAQGKKVAFHAGEYDSEDIDDALAFNPDLLVHCTHATHGQLRECADRNIPIAVCPRSNWALKVARSSAEPPLSEMTALGCTLLLGTDNVMFVQPDMFAEMAFTHYLYGIPAEVILTAAVAGSSLFHTPNFICKGNPARFMVLDPGRSNMRFSRNLRTTLVKRGSSREIVKKVFIL